MGLYHNNFLFQEIFEAIQNKEIEISNHKEEILICKRNMMHIESRILHAQHTKEYIPTMVRIRMYLINRQRITQELLDESLNSLSELRKKILTC